MYAVGYALAGWLGYACFHMSASDPHAQFSWRFPLAFQCFFPLVLLAGSRFVPYSPRWLLSKGRRDEAFEIVKRLHMTKVDVHHIRAREEFYLMEKQYEMDASLPNRWFELFRTPANRKRALVGALLMWGDQFLGIFVMTNYGVLIYASLGLSGSLPLLLNAVWTSFTLLVQELALVSSFQSNRPVALEILGQHFTSIDSAAAYSCSSVLVVRLRASSVSVH